MEPGLITFLVGLAFWFGWVAGILFGRWGESYRRKSWEAHVEDDPNLKVYYRPSRDDL